MLLTLGLAGWMIGLLIVALLLVCAMLILTVLIQKPQGGGLSAAFGASSGSGQTAFGTKTGDALTIFTIVVFIAFLGLSIGLNHAMRPTTTVAAPAANGTDGGAPADGVAPQGDGKKGEEGAIAPVTPAPATPVTTTPATTAPVTTTPAPAPTTPASQPAPTTPGEAPQSPPK